MAWCAGFGNEVHAEHLPSQEGQARLREVARMLKAHNVYLPQDPEWVSSIVTMGHWPWKNEKRPKYTRI